MSGSEYPLNDRYTKTIQFEFISHDVIPKLPLPNMFPRVSVVIVQHKWFFDWNVVFQAQSALNNCVLGNTTIFAEYPNEGEVHSLLQQLSHGTQQQAGATGGAGWSLRPSNKTGPPPDTWGGSSSQLWSASLSSNSLWSNAGIDSNDQQRATPSSLNSYLPGDLLGGESM